MYFQPWNAIIWSWKPLHAQPRSQTIEFDKPKDNVSAGERQALKELSRNKSIIFKKSDKVNTTVLMSRQDKLNKGQVLLDCL